MKISLPEKFANNPIVLDYVRSKSLFKTLVKYVIDWRYKSKRVNLQKWCLEYCQVSALPRQVKDDMRYLKQSKLSNDKKMKKILEYVHNNITYVSDSKNWKVAEKWQTPKETWALKSGDCEDGSVLIYAIAHYIGIPDYQLRIVAGDVIGGGHCYVIYTSNKNAIEYPIDWCYWYSISRTLSIPYVKRNEYMNGEKEWFSFNMTNSYKSY